MESKEFKGLGIDIQQSKNGSMEAKEKIIERYKNFVYKEDLKIKIYNFDIEDIIQVGNFTILKCIDTFNESKNKNFTSYVSQSNKKQLPRPFIKREKKTWKKHLR